MTSYTMIRIADEQKERLRKIALRQKRSLTNQLEIILEKALDDEDAKVEYGVKHD